jgi:uncharacterized protein YjbJ (UPF0337 family)
VVGPATDLNSAEHEHDDDDEEDEAEKATADVDTGCKQHVWLIPADRPGQTPTGRLAIRDAGYSLATSTESRSTMDSNLDQAKGRIKQAAGDITGNKDLKKQGKADEAAGNAKEAVNGMKDKAEGLIDKVRDRNSKG